MPDAAFILLLPLLWFAANVLEALVGWAKEDRQMREERAEDYEEQLLGRKVEKWIKEEEARREKEYEAIMAGADPEDLPYKG